MPGDKLVGLVSVFVVLAGFNGERIQKAVVLYGFGKLGDSGSVVFLANVPSLADLRQWDFQVRCVCVWQFHFVAPWSSIFVAALTKGIKRSAKSARM